jgi:hypothetical protein
MILPIWPPFKAREEGCPFLYDFRLEMLKANRTPPKITPNLIAAMLPVIIKERKPPRDSIKPAN